MGFQVWNPNKNIKHVKEKKGLFYSFPIWSYKRQFQLSSRNLVCCSTRVSSIAQSCPTLCNPMDCSTSAFPVHHQFPEFAQTHVYRVGDAIQPSHSLPSPCPCLETFPASGAFPMSQFFTSGGQSIGVSSSASVLPMNIQDWFPLGLTGLITRITKVIDT